MGPDERNASRKTSTQRQRPIFSTRSATEDDSRLAPSESLAPSPEDANVRFRLETQPSPYAPLTSSSHPEPRQHARAQKVRDTISRWWHGLGKHGTEEEDARRVVHTSPSRREHVDIRATKHGSRAANDADSEKLGTISGVFVPTTLNVLSILMFLRFGFILGQSGVLGMLGMLIVAYIINLLTTMSISAIATNGTVRGGGAYYLISRSLGPEFGGSIGIVFYMGFVLNTAMNALGLIDCLAEVFGVESGSWSNFMPESFWWKYLFATAVLVVCTAICLAGSSLFAKASNALLVIVMIATFSIPFSAVFKAPFKSPRLGIEFTGFHWRTFLENLRPQLTKGAAGSQIKGRENFQDLFGILFAATAGIFAGASMSGDLKNPSKSIPKGTLAGILLTFFTYAVVIVSMAASVTRESMYNNVNIIHLTNISGVVVLLGEFASSFFSSLMGVIGAAKLLQAIAKDHLFPGLSMFSRGTKKSNEPVYAILLTFVATQIAMLFDLNKIASFITMTYLMTFFATNLACFLLKIGSAPNFRPSFHYFDWYTAAAGALISAISMFFVDGVYATGSVALLIILFLLVHYTSPPKSWGDVSQSLIYHQVRKYLLRLRQEHVKFWRPQVLLFVNDLDAQYKIIHFCNSLKKGGLFVLGHVLVTEEFTEVVPETRRQQIAWTKFVEFSKIKAFVNISVAPSAEWGVRNIVLTSGLGGMRPNIVVLDQYRSDQPFAEIYKQPPPRRDSKNRRLSFTQRESHVKLPKEESSNRAQSSRGYLTILDDLLFKLRINVAVARGLENLELPSGSGENTKRFIDLWPIQMTAELSADGESKRNVLTTNFDTYTLILQLGCILHTVQSWRRTYSLRVAVFVEYETDVEEERSRVEALLEKLRIEAEVLVFSLASGNLKTYQVIVNGDVSPSMQETWNQVNTILKEESWWNDIQKFRSGEHPPQDRSEDVAQLLEGIPNWPGASFQDGGQKSTGQRFEGLKEQLMRSASRQRRRSVSSLRSLNVNLGIQTHRLLDTFVDYHSDGSGESTTDESDLEPYRSDIETDESDADDGRDTSRLERSTRQESSNLSMPVRPRAESSQKSSFLRSQPLQNSSENPHASSIQEGEVPTIDIGEAETDPADEVMTSREGVPNIALTSKGDPGSGTTPKRPTFSRTASSKRFSSSPIPEARVESEEGAGPSIMFSESPPTRQSALLTSSTPPRDSIYSRVPTLTSPVGHVASGFPSQAAMPLSFNDLPCRAQHLILNELMNQHSGHTAVMFTTLPSPGEGTCLDDAESEAYLSDMEVLCDGLPPCLLVHSNSMTVTMNL